VAQQRALLQMREQDKDLVNERNVIIYIYPSSGSPQVNKKVKNYSRIIKYFFLQEKNWIVQQALDHNSVHEHTRLMTFSEKMLFLRSEWKKKELHTEDNKGWTPRGKAEASIKMHKSQASLDPMLQVCNFLVFNFFNCFSDCLLAKVKLGTFFKMLDWGKHPQG